MSSNAKIALATGSSRGLGREAALSLAKKGVDVLVTYRSRRDEAEAVVAEIEATGRKSIALALDTGEVKSFDAFADEMRGALARMGAERFDFLVNNPPRGHPAWASTCRLRRRPRSSSTS